MLKPFNTEAKRIVAGLIATRIAYAAAIVVYWTIVPYGLGELVGLLLNQVANVTNANGLQTIFEYIASCIVLWVIVLLFRSDNKLSFNAIKQYIRFVYLTKGIVQMIKIAHESNTYVPNELTIATVMTVAGMLLMLLMYYINSTKVFRLIRRTMSVRKGSDTIELGRIEGLVCARDEKDIDNFFANLKDPNDLIGDEFKSYITVLDLDITKTKALDGSVTGSVSVILGTQVFKNAKNKWVRAFHFPLTSIVYPLTIGTTVKPEPTIQGVRVENLKTEED